MVTASSENAVLRLLGRARVWLVAAVIWLSVIASLDIDLSGGDYQTSPQLWARNSGILASYFVLVAVLRVLWPMRVLGSDPRTLIGGGRTHRVNIFTGSTHSARRTAVTTVTATQSLHTDLSGDVRGRVDLQQQTVLHDQFSLTAANGAQHTVQVRNANVPIGAGQLMTAGWAVPVGAKRGRYVGFANHSTGVTTWVIRDGLGPIALGGSRTAVFGLLWMVAAAGLLAVGGSAFGFAEFFIGLGCYAVVSWIQIWLFRSITSAPLRRLLADEGAAATAAASRLAAQPAVPAGVAPLPTLATAPAAAPIPAPPAPTPLSAPAAPAAPPAWLADPIGRHQHRFWNGASWSEHVSDNGVASIDPL